jgi:hypothetical protein
MHDDGVKGDDDGGHNAHDDSHDKGEPEGTGIISSDANATHLEEGRKTGAGDPPSTQNRGGSRPKRASVERPAPRSKTDDDVFKG